MPIHHQLMRSAFVKGSLNLLLLQTVFIALPRLVEADVAIQSLLNDQPLSHSRNVIARKWTNAHTHNRLVQVVICHTQPHRCAIEKLSK